MRVSRAASVYDEARAPTNQGARARLTHPHLALPPMPQPCADSGSQEFACQSGEGFSRVRVGGRRLTLAGPDRLLAVSACALTAATLYPTGELDLQVDHGERGKAQRGAYWGWWGFFARPFTGMGPFRRQEQPAGAQARHGA